MYSKAHNLFLWNLLLAKTFKKLFLVPKNKLLLFYMLLGYTKAECGKFNFKKLLKV